MAKFELDTEFVRKLAQILHETNLGEIELGDRDKRIRVARPADWTLRRDEAQRTYLKWPGKAKEVLIDLWDTEERPWLAFKDAAQALHEVDARLTDWQMVQPVLNRPALWQGYLEKSRAALDRAQAVISSIDVGPPWDERWRVLDARWQAADDAKT